MPRNKNDLSTRLVGVTANLDEPQGADRILFEAWRAVFALQVIGAKVHGILGRALLQGNLYVAVINVGKLIDNGRGQRNSFKSILKDHKLRDFEGDK